MSGPYPLGDVAPEELRHLLERMWLIRRFEERAAEHYMQGKIGGFLHLAIGEEATVAGCLAGLQDDDPITATYREHGQLLARGTDAGAIMAELFGRESGVSKGRGGSMHLADVSKSIYGGYGIVGGAVPLALGFAFALKREGQGRCACTMFGDGSLGQGVIYECLNMAALWRLPIVFVVSNNQYGMGTPVEAAQAGADLYLRAQPFLIRARQVDGMDPLAVRAAVAEEADLARTGHGPAFIEAVTYRFRGHSMSDPDQTRDRAEKAAWAERDPITLFGQRLVAEGVLSEDEAIDCERWAEGEVDVASQTAEAAPPPDPSGLYRHQYATWERDDVR